jgi:hypothetical protein
LKRILSHPAFMPEIQGACPCAHEGAGYGNEAAMDFTTVLTLPSCRVEGTPGFNDVKNVVLNTDRSDRSVCTCPVGVWVV